MLSLRHSNTTSFQLKHLYLILFFEVGYKMNKSIPTYQSFYSILTQNKTFVRERENVEAKPVFPQPPHTNAICRSESEKISPINFLGVFGGLWFWAFAFPSRGIYEVILPWRGNGFPNDVKENFEKIWNSPSAPGFWAN